MKEINHLIGYFSPENVLRRKIDRSHKGEMPYAGTSETVANLFYDEAEGRLSQEAIDSATQRPTEAFLNPIDLIPEDSELTLWPIDILGKKV